MNTEYVWWLLALVLAVLGTVGFLAFGRIPEIEDEPDEIAGSAAADSPTPGQAQPASGWPVVVQSSPASTTVPDPAPAPTSETP